MFPRICKHASEVRVRKASRLELRKHCPFRRFPFLQLSLSRGSCEVVDLVVTGEKKAGKGSERLGIAES